MILSRQGVNGHYECPMCLTLIALGERTEAELPRLQSLIRTQDRTERTEQPRGTPCRSVEGPGILRQALNKGHIGRNYMNQG